MTPLQFKGYRPGSLGTTIIAERITHWQRVDYNGNLGTVVYLDTGKEVIVGDYLHEVEKKVREVPT